MFVGILCLILPPVFFAQYAVLSCGGNSAGFVPTFIALVVGFLGSGFMWKMPADKMLSAYHGLKYYEERKATQEQQLKNAITQAVQNGDTTRAAILGEVLTHFKSDD